MATIPQPLLAAVGNNHVHLVDVLIKAGSHINMVSVLLPLMGQSKQKLSAFLVCCNVEEASMANSVDPDKTAPIGAVCSGSTLFASILNSSVKLAIICSRRHFQMHFFLAL